MQIYKFGGAALKDADGVKCVGNIIKNFNEKSLVVVVSAMGKTTNALEWVFRYYVQNSNQKYNALQDIKSFHFNILKNLFEATNEVYAKVHNYFQELEKKLEIPPTTDVDFEYDQIVVYGELISSVIVYHYLRSCGIDIKWIDVRNYLITNNNYRDANIIYEHSQSKLESAIEKNHWYLCQGFIGRSIDGNNTTLGREGSDYTAAALAYMLDAKSVTIWKDVPGVLNADPRIMPNTIKLDEISYKEAIELAYYGAQVIHPKTIKPLQNKNIPLYVKPFINPENKGTLIKDTFEKHQMPPIYIFKNQQCLISIMPKDFSFIAEDNLSIIFKHLSQAKIKVNLMQQSAVSFSVCVDYDERKLKNFLNATTHLYNILYNTDLTLVTIRHYTEDAITKVIANSKIIIKEISRNTARFVIKSL